MPCRDKERTSDSQSAASTVEGLEAALREARTSAARQAAQMANLESTLASERRDHDEVAQQLAATRADLQAAINQDSNQAGEWQAQYSSLEGARDRAVAKAHEATAALQRVTESHDKMQAKVLQLASERDHVRLQFEEHKVARPTFHVLAGPATRAVQARSLGRLREGRTALGVCCLPCDAALMHARFSIAG